MPDEKPLEPQRLTKAEVTRLLRASANAMELEWYERLCAVFDLSDEQALRRLDQETGGGK